MLSLIPKILAGTALRKWIIGGALSVVLTLAGVWGWNQYKEGLRNQGREDAAAECREEIYRANQIQLEEQLRLEQERVRALELRNEALIAENEAALTRRVEAERQVAQLLRDRRQQAESDEDYREWSATPLPGGVAERLRELARGSNAGSDSN